MRGLGNSDTNYRVQYGVFQDEILLLVRIEEKNKRIVSSEIAVFEAF